MTEFVAQLQQAMKQQSDDLRDEINELRNWQSSIKEKSANVKKKHENHSSSKTSGSGGEIFAGAAGVESAPPIRYSAEAAKLEQSSSQSSSSSAGSKGNSALANMVSEAKDRGNAYFGRGQYEDAVRAYTQGLDADPTSPLCSVLFANRALSNLKLRRWDSADKDATQSIGLNRTNAKAFYRRALARKQLGQLKEAKTDLDTVQVLVPGDADSAKEIQLVNAMIAERVENENKDHHHLGGGGGNNGSQQRQEQSSSPKRKKIVIQETSDDEDDNEEEDKISPEEQKIRDEKLRREMEEAEKQKAAKRKAQAQEEEAARAKQRKANPRVEIVSDEEEEVVVRPQPAPAPAAPAPEPAVTKPQQQQQQQQQQHQPPRHADPSPPAERPAAAADVSKSNNSTTTSKNASPASANSSQPRKINITIFTADNLPTPQSFAELERIFNEVKGKADVVKVLVAIVAKERGSGDAIAKMLGSNLSNDMYTEFLQGAAEAEDVETTRRWLIGLSRVRVIEDIVMFASEEDRACVKKCIAKCGGNLDAKEKSGVEKILLA